MLLPPALLLCQAWLFRGFIVDDAFISFRYVQQVSAGNGLVYNLGERVEGYSNFLWLMLLVPFRLAGIELTLAAKALGLLFSLSTLGLVWRCGRLLSSRSGFRAIAPLLLAASGPFAAWSVGGLETPLFTFLLTLGVYLCLREEYGQARATLSGFAFALLALTRPEGLYFFGLVMAYRLVRPALLAARDGWRIATFAAIFLPYFGWRFAFYGFLLPNTVYAKSLGLHPRAILEGLIYLYDLVRATGGVLFVALALVVPFFDRERRDAVILLNVLLGGFVVFVLLGGGDWMPMLRFGVHVLPLLYLLVQLAFEQAWTALGQRPAGWARRLAAVLIALVAGQAGYLLAASFEQRFVNQVGAGPVLPAEPAWIAYLRQHLSDTDTVAVIDAGFIAYRLPLEVRVVDMVGLTDAHIAHRPVQLAGGLLGRGDAFGKWDTGYVLAQQPRFVQVNLTGQGDDGLWYTNFTGTTLLVNDPRFVRAYRPVAEPGIAGLFVRREAP